MYEVNFKDLQSLDIRDAASHNGFPPCLEWKPVVPV